VSGAQRVRRAACPARSVNKIVTARRQLEGERFVVRRPFPSVEFSLADTFLLLDHMGAVEYAPGEARLQLWVKSTANGSANWCTRVRPG
jgi:hypothetical protein